MILMTCLIRHAGWLFLGLVLLTTQAPSASEGPMHPRLLFGPEVIPALRERITQEPWQSMYQQLLHDAENTSRPFEPYNDAWSASSCAFLYVLTGDETWAEKARTYTQDTLNYNSGGNRWAETGTFGLRMYMWNTHVALAYDFCYHSDAWQADGFNATVSAALKEQSDLIQNHGGTSQNTATSSNWQGLRGASALLGYLATDDSVDSSLLEGAINRTRNYLNANLGTDSSPGWNYEGLGYMTFPMAIVGPATIAYERLVDGGDRFMGNQAMAHTWWTPTAATALYRTISTEHLAEGLIGSHFDFTDDNNHSMGEGVYGLSFAFLPDALIPGQVWMYDRMRGAAGDQSWDNERSGIIYSILYHPGHGETENPLNIPEWRALFQDHSGNGTNMFRNRYHDEDDIIIGVNLRRRTPGGHNGPDGLSFRINGMGGPLAVGGGRYSSGNPYYRLQNTLYVENPGTTPPSNVSGSRQGDIITTTNTPLLNWDGSGALVGYMSTTNLNVGNHTRRLLSDFSDASGAQAVFVISDTSNNGHFWQYAAVDGINTITTDENSFTVHGPNGSLRATVLYPSSVSFNQGTLNRGSNFFFNGETYGTNRWINFESADGDHLVVLTVVATGEEHPDVSSIAGDSANDRTLAIGDLRVVVDGDDIYRQGGPPPAWRRIVMRPIHGQHLWESHREDGEPVGAITIDDDDSTIIDELTPTDPVVLSPVPLGGSG